MQPVYPNRHDCDQVPEIGPRHLIERVGLFEPLDIRTLMVSDSVQKQAVLQFNPGRISWGCTFLDFLFTRRNQLALVAPCSVVRAPLISVPGHGRDVRRDVDINHLYDFRNLPGR